MRILLVMGAILLSSCYNLAFGSLISLKFVEDYMTLSGLKHPMFILKSSDLDTFFLEMQDQSLSSTSFLCYEEGKID